MSEAAPEVRRDHQSRAREEVLVRLWGQGELMGDQASVPIHLVGRVKPGGEVGTGLAGAEEGHVLPPVGGLPAHRLQQVVPQGAAHCRGVRGGLVT